MYAVPPCVGLAGLDCGDAEGEAFALAFQKPCKRFPDTAVSDQRDAQAGASEGDGSQKTI